MEELKLVHFYSVEEGVIVGEIRSGSISNKAVEKYIRDLKALLTSQTEPFVLVTDVTASEQLSAEQRLMVGTFIKQNKFLMKEKLVGLAYVVPTPLLQIILNGIFLVNRPPVKYKVFNRLAAALSWSKELSKKAFLN